MLCDAWMSPEVARSRNSGIGFQPCFAMLEKCAAASEAVEWVDEWVVKGAGDRVMEVVEMEKGWVQEA